LYFFKLIRLISISNTQEWILELHYSRKIERVENKKWLELISNIMEDKKEMITIVIFMADPDDSWNNRTSNEFHTEFKLFIESGLIHIIIAPQNIYPNLNTIIIKHLFWLVLTEYFTSNQTTVIKDKMVSCKLKR
jgi:hypothetical protein